MYEPMLCEERAEKDLVVLKPEEWIVEEKYDGERAILYYDGSKTTILSRSGRDITDSFPEIRGGGIASFVIDGEIIATDYPTTMKRNHSSKMKARLLSKVYPAVFMAFDVLQFETENTMNRPIEERRCILEELLSLPELQEHIQQITPYAETPIRAFESAKERGLEGIVLKRRNSLYEQRRSGSWIKVKCWKEGVFKIIGLNESNNHGSLLTEMGDVGLLTMKNREFYHQNKPNSVRVKYLEITKRGKLRQPIFLFFEGTGVEK